MSIAFRPELTVAVFVTDWEASRAWYRDKLGLKEGFVAPGGGWAEFEGPVDGAIIGISDLEGEPHPGGGGTRITFGVDDIDSSRAQLEASGVAFAGPTEEMPGMVKLATFHDPDGNVMILAQSLMQP